MVKLVSWQSSFKFTPGTCVFKKPCSTSRFSPHNSSPKRARKAKQASQSNQASQLNQASKANHASQANQATSVNQADQANQASQQAK